VESFKRWYSLWDQRTHSLAFSLDSPCPPRSQLVGNSCPNTRAPAEGIPAPGSKANAERETDVEPRDSTRSPKAGSRTAEWHRAVLLWHQARWHWRSVAPIYRFRKTKPKLNPSPTCTGSWLRPWQTQGSRNTLSHPLSASHQSWPCFAWFLTLFKHPASTRSKAISTHRHLHATSRPPWSTRTSFCPPRSPPPNQPWSHKDFCHSRIPPSKDTSTLHPPALPLLSVTASEEVGITKQPGWAAGKARAELRPALLRQCHSDAWHRRGTRSFPWDPTGSRSLAPRLRPQNPSWLLPSNNSTDSIPFTQKKDRLHGD